MTDTPVCMISGGEGSAFTAHLAAQRHGVSALGFLFTDTLAEDTDLYRFLIETVFAIVGRPPPTALLRRASAIPEWHEDRFGRRPLLASLSADVRSEIPQMAWISKGMDPWETYKKERFLGNSAVDPCSKLLKRQMTDRWLTQNRDPSKTLVYVGIDWTEIHRFDDGAGGGLRPRHAEAGWRYAAPMCEPPYPTKHHVVEWLRKLGIERPRLTREGFAHNNCASHCCKAGHGHRAHQLRVHPARYAFDEANEEDMRQFLGADVSMMSDRAGSAGEKRPLTMRALRERIEAGGQVDMFDIGGCGCFTTAEYDATQQKAPTDDR